MTTPVVPEVDQGRVAEPTVEQSQVQRPDAEWQTYLDELKIHLQSKEQGKSSDAASARQREASQRLVNEERTKVQKEAEKVERTLDVIAEKQADRNLAEHTRFDWIEQQRGYLIGVQKELQEFAHRSNSATQSQTAREVLREVAKGLKGLDVVEQAALHAVQAEQVPQSETTRLSQQALDQLSRSLIHGTGEDGRTKGFEDLRQAERAEIGQRMYQMARFIKTRADYETSFTDEERQNIDNLEREGLQIIGEQRAEQLEAQRYKQVTTSEGFKTVDTWEDGMLSFLADPDGKVQQTFGRNTPGYLRYKREVLAALRDSDILQKMLHKFAHNLGNQESGRGIAAILEQGLSSKREEVQIRALEERAQTEMRERLGVSQEVRDYLVGTYGEDADPVKFIATAKAILTRRQQELLQDTSLSPAEREQRLLLEAARIVGSFASPTGESSQAQYSLSDLLNNSDQEITCSIRALILKQVIADVFTDKGYVVLAENQDATFHKETGVVISQNHVRLVVLDTDNGRGYFVDPLHEATSEYLLEEINGDELEALLNGYEAFKHNPRAAELAVKTRLGMVGVADRVLMADNMNNLATFLLQEGDVEAARSLAEAAIAYNPTTTGYLILALASEGEVKEAYLESALSLSPDLQELKTNHPEQFEAYTTNLAELRVQKTWQEYQQRFEDLKATPGGASRQEWLDFLRDVYGQINRWQKNNTLSSDFNMGVSYITGILYTAADEFYTYLPDSEKGDGKSQADRNIYAQYDALVRLGDVDVSITRNDFQTANTTLEKFNWESQYGSYKNIPGVALALRSMDRQAFRSLTNDKGIYTWQQAGVDSPFYKAAYAALDQDASWYPTDSTQSYEAAREIAADLAFRLYYTDFTWSVRMTFGKRLQGDQKYAGQKGGALAELFDPIFNKGHEFTETEKKMVELIGEANVRAATRGFNDGPGMLTHRRLMLEAIVNFSVLTHQSLHRQFRDARTMEGYEQAQADLEEAIKKVERARRVESTTSYEVKEGEHLRDDWRAYFVRQGYNEGDLANDQYLLSRMREEKAYLDIQVMRFDRGTGETRATYAPEVLGNILIYGEALAAVDGHFSLSDTLYNLLRDVGTAYGSPLRGEDALKEGQRVNDLASQVNEYGYERNLQYERVSSEAARAIIDAVEMLGKVDDIADIAVVRSAIVAFDAANAPGGTYDAAVRAVEAADLALRNFDQPIAGVTPPTTYRQRITETQNELIRLRNFGMQPTNPTYQAAENAYIAAEEAFEVFKASSPAALSTLETNLTNAETTLNGIRTAGPYKIAVDGLNAIKGSDAYKAYIMYQEAITKAEESYHQLNERHQTAVASAKAAENANTVGVTAEDAARRAMKDVFANPATNVIQARHATTEYNTAITTITAADYQAIITHALEAKDINILVNGNGAGGLPGIISILTPRITGAINPKTGVAYTENDVKTIAMQIAKFASQLARRTTASAIAIQLAGTPAEKNQVLNSLKQFTNTTLQDRKTAQDAVNAVRRMRMDKRFFESDSKGAVLSGKVAVIDRLRYDQLLTLDALVELRGLQAGKTSLAVTQVIQVGPGGRSIKGKNFENAGRDFKLVRLLYDKKAELIAGKNNWARMQGMMRDGDGVTRSLTTSSGRGYVHFKFNDEKDSYHAKILDQKAVIAGRVNKSRGDGYVMSYTDDVREVVVNDKIISRLRADKPGKGRFGDAGAAQEDQKALLKRLADPSNEKVWVEGNGHNASYNSRTEEQYRNSRWVDAAVAIQAGSSVSRLWVSPTMAGFLELLMPNVFASPLRKINNQHGISKNNEMLRNWVNAIALSEVTSGKYFDRIRKKRKLSPGFSVVPWIMQFLELLGLNFVIHMDQVTGFVGGK